MDLRSRTNLNTNTKQPQNQINKLLSPSSRSVSTAKKTETTPSKLQQSTANGKPPKTPVSITSTKTVEAEDPGQLKFDMFVCSICKNTQSIKDFNLSDEAEKLSCKTTDLKSIIESLGDSAGKVNAFDLSVRHLLLNSDKLTEYQNNIQSIEHSIAELNTRLDKALTITPKPHDQADERMTRLENLCSKISQDILNIQVKAPDPESCASSVSTDISEIRRAIENLRSSPTTPVDDKKEFLFPEHDTSMPPMLQQPPLPQHRNHTPHFPITQNPKRKLPSGVTKGPFKSLSEEIISPEMCKGLLNHYLGCTSEFATEGSCRKTLYYGDHDYQYNGGRHKKREMPENIRDVIELVKNKFPRLQVNSCLVTIYSDGGDHCPMHADNESWIDPESDIITVSLGATRTMAFESQFHGSESKTVELTNGSVLCFSRKSQEYWKHAIVPDSAVTAPRISLTLRHIAPYFMNSTVILGDSNTKYLKFGPGSREDPAFGIWLPGKRVKVSKVLEIPNAHEIAPYRNVIIHTGINDICDDNPPSPAQLVHTLECKCAQIHNESPHTKIIVCPLLPTKDGNLNHKINMVNFMIHQLCEKDARTVILFT